MEAITPITAIKSQHPACNHQNRRNDVQKSDVAETKRRIYQSVFEQVSQARALIGLVCRLLGFDMSTGWQVLLTKQDFHASLP
jgi:hypothetical protein